MIENHLYSGHDEVADPEHFMDMCIEMIMIDIDSDKYKYVVGHLIKAYWALLEANGKGASSMNGKEAETFMSDNFHRNTRHDDRDCVFSWPEALPHWPEADLYPKKMLVILTKILIQKDKIMDVAMAKYLNKKETR